LAFLLISRHHLDYTLRACCARRIDDGHPQGLPERRAVLRDPRASSPETVQALYNVQNREKATAPVVDLSY
jgi:hypothetical protein